MAGVYPERAPERSALVETIVDPLERKDAHRRRSPEQFTNVQLGTL